MRGVSLHAIPDIPDIQPGDDLARIIGDALWADGMTPQTGDILVIAHKVFSKAEGNIHRLGDIEPSAKALEMGEDLAKDPRKIEVVLGQSKRVVRAFKRPSQNEGTMICEHKLGFISANAGVDQSNTGGEDFVITLPDDPDASARAMGAALEARFGVLIGVVMTDTFGRPWRLGQVNVAIGLHRVPARVSELGKPDAWGRELSVTEPALADEIAAASGLVVKKAAKTPVVVMRGLYWQACENASAQDMLRAQTEDMFR